MAEAGKPTLTYFQIHAKGDFIRMALAKAGVDYNEALMMPLRRCQNATRFKRTPSGGFLPTFPSDPEGINKRLYDFTNEESSKLRSPEVTMDDFRDAITRNKPSVGQEDLQQYEDWTAEFGQDA